MLAARVYHYRDAASLTIGLSELRRQGMTPRGLLFLALDPRGEAHVAVPDDFAAVTAVKVGEKLTLKAPFEGRFFHFDSLHRLPVGGVLYTGDRRLKEPGNAVEVACMVADWIKGSNAKNVFLGCTPHQPGAWYARDDRSPAAALHEAGYVDVTTAASGLLARRIGFPHLYYLPYAQLAAAGPLAGWTPIFDSPLGNVLMLERRVLAFRLVLTCERGLVEVELSALPAVVESARVELSTGLGVVGRVDGGAFAVTAGEVHPWGLEAVQPALLIGAHGDKLADLARALMRPA